MLGQAMHVILSPVVTSAFCWMTATQAPSPDELIAIMREREAAIISVSVRMRVLHGDRSELGDGTLTPMKYTNDLYEVTEESGGRCRIKKITQTTDQRSPQKDQEDLVDVIQLAVFDGNVTRLLTSSLEKPLHGSVLPGKSMPRMPLWGSVFPVITRFSTTPLSQFLEKHRSDTTRYELANVDGKELLLIEVATSDDSRSKSVFKLALDPAAAYSQVKVEIWDQKGTEKPHLRLTYEMADLLEIASGVWFPGRTRFRAWGIVDAKSKRESTKEVDAVFEGWRLDPPRDSKMFTLSFPKGIVVFDSVQKTSYTSKEVDDVLVAQQVAEAKRLWDAYKDDPKLEPPRRSSMWPAALAAFALVGATVLSFIMFRLWVRSRSKDGAS